MSFSLVNLQGELREGYLRMEEVMSGMDAYIAKLEKRIVALERRQTVIDAALRDDESEPSAQAPRIYTGR